MLGYAPYVALNRLQREMQQALQVLGLAKYTNPQLGQALLREADVTLKLTEGKALIAEKDVAARFGAEVGEFASTIGRSLSEAHVLLNGKWIVGHYAQTRTNKPDEVCRAEWYEAVRAAGGSSEVRDLWRRITGNAP
jgi:hypothetical protein